MTSQERFAVLQQRWRKADEKQRELSFDLRYRYGDSYRWQARKAELTKLDKAQKAAEIAMEAIFAWLDSNSPRQWRSGAPCCWVCDELTYEDATTSGPLSVLPPPAYGYTQSHVMHFAAAVA